MPTKIIYTPNYTVVGSPTISDDYTATFSSGSLLKPTPQWTYSGSPWAVELKFTTPSSYMGGNGVCLFRWGNNDCMLFLNHGGYVVGCGWNSYPRVSVSLNTTYWLKVEYDGTKLNMYLSTTGEYPVTPTDSSSSPAYWPGNNVSTTLGAKAAGSETFNGSIDLKEVRWYSNGVKVWEALTGEVIDVSGSVSVSKGYYDNGSNKILMTSAITKSLSEVSSGETIGYKNKMFAYSKDDVADILITADSNEDISTAHDISVELDKNVYLSCLKNYIIGHTPLPMLPMQIGGELTADYTASDNSVIDSDYILTSTTSGKYVYKAFSESNVTTAEVTVKCKQTATKYRSDVFSGWGIVGFVDGNLGVWNGSNWRTGTYYPAGTWVWVKAISTPASGTIQIYGLLDNGYTLDTLPATSQWDLCYNGSISYGSPLTSSLYIPDSGGSEWFNGQVDLKEVQVKKNGTEIWRAVSTSTNAIKNSSNGFVYDSTNDTTFWYPKETILELRNFTDLQDRCNLYLANEDGKDVSRLLAGSSLPGPIKTNYVVEGSPTINSSYEASNFTSSNYISLPETIPSADGTSIITAIKVSGSPSSTQGIIGNSLGVPNFYIESNKKFGCYNGSTSREGSTAIADNTKYWVQIRYTSSNTRFLLLQDNGYTLDTLPDVSNWNVEMEFSGDVYGGKELVLGALSSGSLPFTVGTCYLADTAIATNGVYVWKAVEQNPVIASSKQQGYVYLNHAHNEVIGIGEEPDEIVLEAVAETTQNYTVVGSPVISDNYIASSFNSRNGVAAPVTLDTSKPWRIFAKINSGSNTSTRQKFIGCANSADQKIPTLEFRNGRVYACMPNSAGSGWLFEVDTGFVPSTNTDYWFKYGWDGSTYSVEVSTDGESYTSVYTNSSQTAAYHSDSYKVIFGNDLYGGSYHLPFFGTVDLKECYFVVDGAEVWRAVSTGAQNTVKASDSNYWTYLKDSTYNCKGRSVGISSMTGSALSGYLLATPIGALIYTGSNNQGLLGDAFTGYTVTFTNTSHSAIASLTKTGTRCRCYSAYNGNVENPHYYSFYVTSLPVTGEIPMSMTSFIGEREITPSSSTSSYTYDAATDTITYSGYTASYAGDVYVNLGA